MNVAGLNLRDLEYVVTVADLRHFGRAAQACAVSQPTLSAQIRKLEEFLGVEIFERSARQVLVTPRGTELVAQARRVLEEARRLAVIAHEAGEPLAGAFRLGVLDTLGPYLVPLLLHPLRARFPRLRLLIQEGRASALLAALERGEADAVLLATPPRDQDPTLLALCREELVLAVPRDHPLATVPQVTAAEVPVEQLILPAEGHCLREQVLALVPARARLARPDDDLQAASLETLRQMVAAGIGCGFLPQLAVQVGSLLDDMVAYRRIVGAPGRDVVLAHRASFGRIRDVRLLREAIREVLAAGSAVVVAGRGIKAG
jgi:LysR family hydrogen peroxide-inducible transcriptional activator